MRRMSFVIVLLTSILATAACEPPTYRSVDAGLYTIAANAIPNGYAAHGASETQILESDDYGRVLFEYTMTAPDVAYSELYALVICQQRDEKRVAYYEDSCFIVKNGWDAPFDEAAVAALKTQNDWGLPLEAERMIWRDIMANGKDADRSIGYQESIRAAKKILEDKVGPVKGSNIVLSDVDANGKMLLFAQYWLDGTQENARRCFVMIERDGSCIEETCCEEAASLYHYQEQMHAFKEENGWNFGDR